MPPKTTSDSSAASSPARVRDPAAPARIVVIDDDPTTLTLVAAVLAAHEVTAFDRPREALGALEARAPRQRGERGFETDQTARRVRRLPLPTTPEP